MNLKTQLVVNA